MKFYTMERDLYKQIKLEKTNIDKTNQNLKLKQNGNKGNSKLQPISLISYPSKKKQKRSCNKSVKLQFSYSTEKDKLWFNNKIPSLFWKGIPPKI